MSDTDRLQSFLAGKRCLVVEDEFLIALDYERILQSAGATDVLLAGRLAEAERILKSAGQIDLALLDVNLNGESSLPLARRLFDAGVPVIVVTGLSERLLVSAGYQDMQIVEKPFEERSLLSIIGKLVRRSE